MNRRSWLQLVAGTAAAAPAGSQVRPGSAAARFRGEPGRTAAPITYIIDYATNHMEDSGFVARVAQSPPQLLHVGHDLPFKSAAGPRQAPLPLKQPERFRLLDPAGARGLKQSIEEMVRNLHRSGVEIVIPYIDNQQMGGDADRRSGFWEFYDRWDDYRNFGLPPKPPTDPIRWMQTDPEGNIQFNEPKAYAAYAPEHFYAPCPNNEHWRRWLEFVVADAARCGYDGVFVDNIILRCYCPYCRAAFRRYLRARYRPEELARNFGEGDAGKLDLHAGADKTDWAKKQPEFRDFLLSRFPLAELRKRFRVRNLASLAEMNEIGNGFLQGRAREFVEFLKSKYTAAELRRRYGTGDPARLGLERPAGRRLWYETQRFWADSVSECLLRLRGSAEKHRPGFLVLPNWGAMATVPNVNGRRQTAKNVAVWGRGCYSLMFEEDGMPGRLAPGVYHDFISNYRFAFANGIRPVVLPYGAQSAGNLALANAEAAAGGGGAYVQTGYGFPEVRKVYRAFFGEHRALFTGLRPLAHVALAFLFDQTHFENVEHLRHVYRLKRALSRGHVPFEFFTEADLATASLERCRVLILPETRYIGEREILSLRKWVAGGGILVLTGELPACDDSAAVRPSPAFSDWFPAPAPGVGVVPVDGGKAAWARRVSDLAPLPEAEAKLLETAGSQLMDALERVAAPGPQPAAPLISLLSELSGNNLAIVDRAGLSGLRAGIYWGPQSTGARIALHLVNYELTAKENPEPARNIDLRVLLPRGGPWRAAGARVFVPGRSGTALDAHVRDGYLTLRVPEVSVYTVVDASLRYNPKASG